jgi:hypothetical protein
MKLEDVKLGMRVVVVNRGSIVGGMKQHVGKIGSVSRLYGKKIHVRIEETGEIIDWLYASEVKPLICSKYEIEE